MSVYRQIKSWWWSSRCGAMGLMVSLQQQGCRFDPQGSGLRVQHWHSCGIGCNSDLGSSTPGQGTPCAAMHAPKKKQQKKKNKKKNSVPSGSVWRTFAEDERGSWDGSLSFILKFV